MKARREKMIPVDPTDSEMNIYLDQSIVYQVINWQEFWKHYTMEKYGLDFPELLTMNENEIECLYLRLADNKKALSEHLKDIEGGWRHSILNVLPERQLTRTGRANIANWNFVYIFHVSEKMHPDIQSEKPTKKSILKKKKEAIKDFSIIKNG